MPGVFDRDQPGDTDFSERLSAADSLDDAGRTDVDPDGLVLRSERSLSRDFHDRECPETALYYSGCPAGQCELRRRRCVLIGFHWTGFDLMIPII